MCHFSLSFFLDTTIVYRKIKITRLYLVSIMFLSEHLYRNRVGFVYPKGRARVRVRVRVRVKVRFRVRVRARAR